MHGWIEVLFVPVAVLAAVCYAANYVGKRIRAAEVSELETEQSNRTTEQFARIRKLKGLLGEEA